MSSRAGSDPAKPIRIGIMGAGQLGQMLAEAADKLGLRVSLFFDEENPCGARAARYVRGSLQDQSAVRAFASDHDVLSAEFENIPLDTLTWAASERPFFPAPSIFAVAQDRLREKELATMLGIPVPPYRAVATLEELRSAFAELGSRPAILKSRSLGYDGKGQVRVLSPNDLEAAWRSIGERPALLEQLFDFEREVSIIGVRSPSGETKFYDAAVNTHRQGILIRSVIDGPATRTIQPVAESVATKILAELDYVGVIAIELFEKNGELYLNEIAPRVHNTGHWSIEGTVSSQFENHLRAISGMPLGDTACKERIVMLNIIGAEPDQKALESLPRSFLHLYGKEPRSGRKLGHFTLIAPSAESERLAETLILDRLILNGA